VRLEVGSASLIGFSAGEKYHCGRSDVALQPRGYTAWVCNAKKGTAGYAQPESWLSSSDSTLTDFNGQLRIQVGSWQNCLRQKQQMRAGYPERARRRIFTCPSSLERAPLVNGRSACLFSCVSFRFVNGRTKRGKGGKVQVETVEEVEFLALAALPGRLIWPG